MTNGGYVTRDFGGGGSGGSILIQTEALTGGHTGVIQARGGSVSTHFNGGGGAGGRIAVYYNNTIKDAFFGGTFDADGGSVAAASENGASGTLYLLHRGQNVSKLIVDNKNGWAMDTEIAARGRKIELFNGFSWGRNSFSKNGFTVSSSCSIHSPSYTYYSLSSLFDQTYKVPYFSSGRYSGSFIYTGVCHSGHILIKLPAVTLINSVRVFPVRGTNFKVFEYNSNRIKSRIITILIIIFALLLDYFTQKIISGGFLKFQWQHASLCLQESRSVQ